jgi:hypothetical protein
MSVTNTTTVQNLDMDIEALLGADNIMLPADETEDKKPSFFERKPVDISFLDKKNPVVDSANPDTAKPDAIDPEDIAAIMDATPDEDPVKPGRKPVVKEGLVELTNKLFEKKLLVPFDDEKSLNDYSVADFEELIEANFADKEKSMHQNVAKAFYEAMPPEFAYAARYLEDGGEDLKGLFKSLAAVEEVRDMDPTKENDAKTIVRSYLQATNFGNAEEIEEEITSWDDRGEIEAKAQKFKPKLDAMTKQQVEYKLKEQAHIRKQQEAQSQMYMDDVYRALEPGELNGLKLDKKTQNILFSGLVQPNYPSMSGRNTNLMGHLLEKYQYMEPNHGLIAEALWLLADPDGYRNKVRETTKKDVVAATVRTLKTEEARKNQGTDATQDTDNNQRKTGGIPRPTKGFFKR